MKNFKRVTSLLLALIFLFINIQISHINDYNTHYVYAADNDTTIELSANPLSADTSSTVTAVVYDKYIGLVQGVTLAFSTSFGVLDSTSEVTDASGEATVTISSDTSGTAIVEASLESGETDSIEIQFEGQSSEVEDIPLAVKLDDFSNADNVLQINRDASIIDLEGSSALRINSNTEDSEGSVYTKNKINLNDDKSFSTYFAFRTTGPIGLEESYNGGRGFTFTLQGESSTAYASDTYSMNTGNINPRFSIHFYSSYYPNSNQNNYIQMSHMGYGDGYQYGYRYLYETSGKTVEKEIPYDILDGSEYYVWIEYDGSSKNIEIRISDEDSRPENALLSKANISFGNLESVFATEDGERINEIYAGFTGCSLTDRGQNNYITKWYFKNDSTPIDVESNTYKDVPNLLLSSENPDEGEKSSIITAFSYDKENNPVIGVPIDFSTNLGVLDSTSVITDASGKASVELNSDIPGTALVKAITSGGAFASTEVPFTFTDEEEVNGDKEWLTDERVLDENDALDDVIYNLNLPLEGVYNSTIHWESTDEAVVSLDGTVIRPEYTHDNREVTLTATISNGSVVTEKIFNITVKALSQADMEADEDVVAADKAWLTEEILLSSNSDLSSVTDDLYLPELGANGSIISWESSDETAVATEGTVLRPNYTQEDLEVTLTASISNRYAEDEKIFNVTIKAMDPPGTALALKYDDSSSMAGILKYNGGSGMAYEPTLFGPRLDNYVQCLTSDYDQGGNFFSKRQIHLPDNMSFSTHFEFLIEASIGATDWGEGFTFMMQAAGNDAFINDGPSMGTLGIEPSVSIEFDTKAQDDPSELGTQHTAVFLNGNYDSPEAVTALPCRIREGQLYQKFHVWIEYDGNDDILEMRIAEINSRPEGATLTVEDLNLEDVFTTDEGNRIKDIYAGFTANTNAGSADGHYILQWHFKNDSEPIETDKDTYIDASSIGFVSEQVLGETSRKIDVTLYEAGFNTPVAGVPIDFYTSSGILNINSVITDQYGKASVILSSDSDTSVTAVVKAIALGGAFVEREVQLDNYAGDVSADKAWLTDEMVLNGNDDLDNIINTLNMPTKGEYGSDISWESSDETVIAADGTVTRPDYIDGDRAVILTATISKGDAEQEKTFNVTVKALYQSDEESVATDKEWLTVSQILGNNQSQNSITDNLELPLTAPSESSITWESTVPTVISNTGEVTRPEYPNHQSVTMTATLEKGDKQETKEFVFTVIAESDTEAPYVIDTDPEDNREAVLCDTKQITVTLNENIKQGTNWNEIKVGYFEMVRTGPQTLEQSFIEVESFARIDDNKLIMTINSDMKSLCWYQLIIPENSIEDLSANPISREFTLRYKIEKKETEELKVVDSNPMDKQENVSVEMDQLTFHYGAVAILEGTNFNDISLRNRLNEELSISREINGNTLTLSLEDGTELQLGEAYIVNIPSGAVTDRFERNSEEEAIQFKMRTENVAPEISSIYPVNDMYGPNVYQCVDLRFSEKVKADFSVIVLLDDKGNRVPSKAFLYNNNQGMILDPIKALEPQTKYTVLLPADSIWDYSDNHLASEYKMHFTTGTDLLNMDIINISYMDGEVSLDSPLQVQFSSSVVRGSEFTNIKITDSQGDTVPFQTQELENNVLVKPNVNLKPTEMYTIDIPADAYRNTKNDINDALKVKFITTSPLDIDGSLLENPSPYYVINIPVKFGAEGIEDTFDNMGREIDSYEWTFSDGSKQIGKTAEKTYTEAGEYLVTLDIVDSKGVAYEYNESIIIVEPGDVAISISPDEHAYVIKSEDEEKNSINYTIEVPVKSVPVIGRVKASLYQIYWWGEKFRIKTYDDIEIPNTGIVDFELDYNDLAGAGDLWSYELVFEYEEWGKTKNIYRSIKIYDMDIAKLKMVLYDSETGSRIDPWQWPEIEVKVDGETKTAEWTWFADGRGYVIKDITNVTHEVQVIPPVNYYPSDKKVFSISDIEVVELEPLNDSDRPKLRYIKSQYTDSRDSDPKIFINKQPKDENLNFTIEGDWNGYEPGYIELQTTAGKKILTQDMDGDSTSVLLKYLTWHLSAGEGIKARIVSKGGTTSPWVDAKLIVAPYLDQFYPIFSQSTGEYDFRSYIMINELLSDKIPVLEEIPLLDKAESFGTNYCYVGLKGSMDDDGRIEVLGGNSGLINSLGYKIGAAISVGQAYQYYPSLNEWKFAQGDITVMATGGYTMKKSMEIPGIKKIPGINKINVKGYGKLIMQADVGGTFIVLSDAQGKKDYQGILYFSPDVEVVLGAGNSAVKIEGYGGGRIDAQLHIPTGYVQVDPSLRMGIRGKFLLFEGNIYSAEAKTSWNNGKEKVPVISARALSQPLMAVLDVEDFNLKPMSRDYLEQESLWLAGSEKKLEAQYLAGIGMSGYMIPKLLSYDESIAYEPNPKVEMMENNIYPDAEIQLVQSGDELWMLWTDDNPERDSMNRTQLRYSVLKDGAWSAPIWMGQDGTADFTPVSASAQNGVLMAWQNIKQVMGSDAEMDTFIENAEISVTESVFKSDGSEVQLVMLTDDDKFDHSPQIAADGDSALLVWTKSEGIGLPDEEDSENSDRLMFSSWNGSSWTDPREIANSLPNVINSSLTMHENEGLLLYTLDMGEDATEQEQRIFAKVYNGTSWEEEILISGDTEPASNPKAVYINGKWFMTWYEDGTIMYKEGLDGETKTSEFLSKVQYDYDMIVKEGTNPQIALVYKQSGDNCIQTISTSFYDIEKGVWSDAVPLTEGEGYVRAISPVFTENGKLNIAYTQAEVILEVIEGLEYYKPGTQVALRTLSYTPVHDLELNEEDGLLLSHENPVPGSTVTVTANIRNEGDFAENATLYLYDGNRAEGDKKIGEVRTIQPIPARSSAEVEVEWFVDIEEREKYNIYAVVDPEDAISEIDEENNTISHEIVSADIAVVDLECQNIAKDDYLVTATIENSGSKALEGMKVYLNYNQSEEPLESRDLDQLEPGQKASLTFIFSATDLAKDENGVVNMSVTAVISEIAEEFNSDNNTYSFVLNPASIVVNSMDPGSGENQVGIQQALTLEFNMSVEQGGEFDQIVLQDDLFNIVDISKTLEGDTLVVSPQSPMDYDTRYTLTIPKRALADSYGHTMDDTYSLSFVTTKSSPEIVFNYPGDGMGNAALDTGIKIQFNQEVLKGATLEEIALYGTNSVEIPVSVSLQQEWIYVKPTENLDENTHYSILIPAGAVQNEMGEVLQEDYLLEFSTGESIENADDDSDSQKEYSSKKSDIGRHDYRVTHQVLEDGSSMAIVDIDEQSILELKSVGAEEVVINVTDAVRDDKTIRVNLTANALNQLLTNQVGLQIVTGKGDIRLPAELIKFLAGEGKDAITIDIAEKDGTENENGRISGVYDFTITVGDQQITEFAPGVVVTIPIQIAGVGNAKRVIVCVYDEDTDNWQPVGGVADEAKGSITFRTEHFSTFAAFETIKHFDDVVDSWAREEIEVLASRRLIFGKTEKTFAPGDSITRAEFTAMIVRSLYTELFENKGIFKDVPEDAWFADYVETAYEMGLVNGCGDSKFAPSSPISREQMATIAYRLYQYKTGTESIDEMSYAFTDAEDISSYAEEAVNFVANAGIMIGNGGSFKPGDNATRQETAVVVYRLLEYMREL